MVKHILDVNLSFITTDFESIDIFNDTGKHVLQTEDKEVDLNRYEKTAFFIKSMSAEGLKS